MNRHERRLLGAGAATFIAVIVLALALLVADDGGDNAGPRGLVEVTAACDTPESVSPAIVADTPYGKILQDYEALCPQPLTQAPPRSAFANGRIPPSQLSPIYRGELLKPYAASWNAMNKEIWERYHFRLYPLGAMSSYRTFAEQQYLFRTCRHRGWCAVPGTSNHGWARAVDLANCGSFRRALDAVGRKYGWSKATSDASWECWHIRGIPGWSGRDPGPLGGGSTSICKGKRVRVGGECRPVLRHGSRGKTSSVKLVQRTLRNEGYCAVRVNGHYDRITRSRVKRFQRAHGLPGDAVIGARTWRKIERFRRGESRCRT